MGILVATQLKQAQYYSYKYLILLTSVCIVMILILITTFQIVNNTFVVPEEWSDNLYIKCGVYDNIAAFQSISLIASGSFVFGYSAYLGILFQAKFLNGQRWYS